MNKHALRSRIGPIAAFAIALAITTAALGIAQQNAIKMEDPATGNGVVWWVVGAGGTLGSGSDQGAELSATIGQAAIDRSENESLTAYYGFWLPQSQASSVEFTNDGATYNNALGVSVAPNPFKTMTTIGYRLPASGRVVIQIYDLVGNSVRDLADGMQYAGMRSVQWDGTNDRGEAVATGSYLFTIETHLDGVAQSDAATSARGIINHIK